MILVMAVLLATVQMPQEPFMLPCEVPYECATDIRVANATATWKMTFDRRRPGIYDVVHWEIRYTDGRRAEYLANLVRPAEGRMHYRFFIRERRGIWYTLWLRHRWVWRQVKQPSAEHDAMVVRVQTLYSISHALRHDADPMALRF